MPYTYTNSAATTVAGGSAGLGSPLAPTDTTLHLPTGDGALFPASAPFMVRLGGSGLAKCTLRSTDDLTIVRGQDLAAPDGPTATDPSWPVGTTVELVVTAGSLTDLASDVTTNTTDIATNTSSISSISSKQSALRDGLYVAGEHGLVEDGVTDDGPAFRTLLDTVRTAGGGVIQLGAGTYFVNSSITHPVTGGGQKTGLVVGSNTIVRGYGQGVTTIKFGSLDNQCWLISNYQTISTYSDRNIRFESLTIDGNAGAQNTAVVDAQDGINLVGVANAAFRDLEIKHVFGTTAGANGPNGTNGEGMAIKLQGCDHVSHESCYLWSDKVLSTSTGFSANKCNDVTYTDCKAEGWKNSMGFTHWTCWSVRHTNCWSTNNGDDGFHSEVTDGAAYVNCQAGGTTLAAQTALYASGTVLGNGAMGFHLFQCARAQLVNCIAQKNVGSGLYADSATGAVGSIQVLGGSFTNNGNCGIRLNDAASVTATEIKGTPETSGNTATEVLANGVAFGLRNVITSPTVPATTVDYTNNYGTAMMVMITGGTVTIIKLDGITVASGTGSIPVTLRVRPGGTINITYTVAPGWKWENAG